MQDGSSSSIFTQLFPSLPLHRVQLYENCRKKCGSCLEQVQTPLPSEVIAQNFARTRLFQAFSSHKILVVLLCCKSSFFSLDYIDIMFLTVLMFILGIWEEVWSAIGKEGAMSWRIYPNIDTVQINKEGFSNLLFPPLIHN